MKQIYVNQIGERDQVDAVFLVRDRIQAMARNGKPYMTLKLMDSTGEIEARVWDRVDEFASLFEKDDFLHVSGRGNLYMGKMQLVVQQLRRVAEEDVDLADPGYKVWVEVLWFQTVADVDHLFGYSAFNQRCVLLTGEV